MPNIHQVRKITFSNSNMTLIVDGISYTIDLKIVSPKLAKANSVLKNDFTISPSGYGIHWKMLDEDLSIDGLIKTAKQQIKLERRTRMKDKV